MIPLNDLLQVRDQLITIYKKYERFIIPILKFIFTATVFFLLSKTMGYAKPLTKTSVILIMALVSVFFSPQLMTLFFILVTSLHAGAGSLEAGIIVFVLLVMIYLLFVRLYPRESLFIVGTLLAYKFNIPYIIPLIGGLFSSLASIVALVIGITIWYGGPQIIIMMENQGAELSDVVGVINAKITTLQEVFKTNQTLLASVVILSMVLLTVYIIRKQNIDYAEYLAILVGSVMNLIGFLFAIILLKAEVNIPGLMIATLFCAVLATLAQFFAKAADYSRAEVVQFEDEKNYYYVKVVPKIIVNKSKIQVQQNYTKNDQPVENRQS